MKLIWTTLLSFVFDLVAFGIGFLVIWLINPTYSGGVSWFYFIGIGVAFTVWLALHFLLDFIIKK